jgi:hypothetical protein
MVNGRVIDIDIVTSIILNNPIPISQTETRISNVIGNIIENKFKVVRHLAYSILFEGIF